ncbi:MAG TPA: hypothetical protein VFX43_08425, partial [Chitinophagaceae bacterium]|nr:hypothetical protein [Chitinophagaceae bacterium]
MQQEQFTVLESLIAGRGGLLKSGCLHHRACAGRLRLKVERITGEPNDKERLVNLPIDPAASRDRLWLVIQSSQRSCIDLFLFANEKCQQR